MVVSGIGCSSRFPYYMNTYGFHSIHGRAPAIATGIKIARPELEVWVVTGDGDALSIGGNHLIHCCAATSGIKILLFNNRIYGLTKGQYSPTSEVGKKTKSTPYGSIDQPFHPLSLALGAEATFVARSVDVFQPHLKAVLKQAAAHQGTAFVEILQNCNIFNDGAWETITEKDARDENTIALEHGQPLVFGKAKDKGIRMNGLALEVVTLGNGVGESDLIVHDERDPESCVRVPALAHGRDAGLPDTHRRAARRLLRRATSRRSRSSCAPLRRRRARAILPRCCTPATRGRWAEEARSSPHFLP